ncbi:putative tellurium resistance membrane protein TerC [Constrictibacter sp. MBR-5]|uniref:hypothetical protein n=1 Tax=Constrictibacter sp. MBR-5 TaxID=3156467 RepID=UPI0033984D1B
MLHRFAYRKQALATLPIFIGGKACTADLRGWERVSPEWSLAITFLILGTGIAYSIRRTRAVEKARAD